MSSATKSSRADRAAGAAAQNSGDLAVFVAAAIRDKVVTDQQTEIQQLRTQVAELQQSRHQLQHQLQQKNPHRSIQIREAGGRLLADSRVNLSEEQGPMMTLFQNHHDVALPIREFYNIELAVDGERALWFRDLDAASCRYSCCTFTNENFAYVRLEYGQDFLVHAFLGPLSDNEYCAIAQVPPSALNKDQSTAPFIFDNSERRFPIENLLRIIPDKNIKFAFDEESCMCTADFIWNFLQVPYMP